MSKLNTVDYDKLTSSITKQAKNPFAYLIYIALGYPIAAILSANVSMALSATVWTSAWTYFWLAVGTLFAPLFILGTCLAIFLIPIAVFFAFAAAWLLIKATWRKVFPTKSRWIK